MARFSSRTLRMLGDEFSGSWTLSTIAELFDDARVALGPASAAENVSGERRSLYRQYLATLDLDVPGDLAKLVEVVNHVLDEMMRREYTEPLAVQSRDRFLNQLRRDGFALEREVDDHNEETVQIAAAARIDLSPEALASLEDPSAIRDHLERLNQNLEGDPRLAVSVAKDMVESTAKLVLRARGVAYTKGDGIPALVARAQETLKLNASGVDGSGEEAKALRRILGALTTLTQGITELRNQVGTGHGRESVPTWVRPRHARLAAGAAQAWCQLMLETLEDPDAPWRTATENS
ncbi:abortive infection family protein [Nocardioides sp.]|uniref:abortive infection family protein n=1 Tax=Nocardioides sp. TaxID=35761 RepID=UPI0035157E53